MNKEHSIARKIYCSAGTFTGRANNRNHRLVLEYGNAINCDGFEIMMMSTWYDSLALIAREYRGAGLVCPVLHADKSIGTLLGQNNTDKSHITALRELWEKNCAFAAEIGVQKIVAHLWGPPESDTYFDRIAERSESLLEIAAAYSLDLVAENVICTHGSPLAHIEELCRRYPALGVTIDTRQSQFCRETEKTRESGLWQTARVRHIHISDFHGAYKDWASLYPILAPGTGDVDYPAFFTFLNEIRYAESLTLEAPSIQKESGVDIATLNKSLDFIRNGLKEFGPAM